MFSLLYGSTLISIHDYWKNDSFDYMDLCLQSDISDFNTLSRLLIAFLSRSKHRAIFLRNNGYPLEDVLILSASPVQVMYMIHRTSYLKQHSYHPKTPAVLYRTFQNNEHEVCIGGGDSVFSSVTSLKSYTVSHEMGWDHNTKEITS